MVDKFQKLRATQVFMDGIAAESGPVYGVRLPKELPISGGMTQALPSRRDLEEVRTINERVVAGYEVLASHFANSLLERERLKEIIRGIASGKSWSPTTLQESIGDLTGGK